MASKKHNDHTQQEKQIAFATMARVHREAIAAGNFVAAHVVAFSFLEDRVTAMDVVRGRLAGKNNAGHHSFMKRVRRLYAAGDISEPLAKELETAAGLRNVLFHGAMWNLSVFSEALASGTLALGRKVDGARRAQKKAVGQ